jgi:hypothetical protein
MHNKATHRQCNFERRWGAPRVSEVVLFLLGFLLLPAFLFAAPEPKPINAFNGVDWRAWSYQTRYTFVIGFLVGAYATQQGAGNMGFLSYAEVEQLQLTLPRRTTVARIVSELDGFYAREDPHIPLTMALVMRNDRGVPPWSVLSKSTRGWSYIERSEE